MDKLTPIGLQQIADYLNFPKDGFANSTAASKWFYFYLIHYGIESSQVQYMIYKMNKEF